jgi:dihydroflavonol-4-reductase
MRVLVTGANGFLSGHIVRELLRRDHTVRAMMRPGAKAHALAGLDIEITYGNITSIADVIEAVRGCDIVIHAAADTSQSHRRAKDYYPVNVEATSNIIEAVSAEKCKRLIFVSSANTMGFGTLRDPGDETTPISPLFLRSGYAKSKLMAQQLVMEAVAEKKIDAVVVNPTFMIGPVDHNPHSGRIFKMVLNRKLVLYPPGGKNFVDVRDAAKGIVNAIHNGKSGECYLISGENLSFREFFRRINTFSAQNSKLIAVPAFVIKLSGIIGSILRRLGITMELNYTNAKLLCIHNYFRNDKAVRDLGLTCSGIDKTIVDYLHWVRAEYGGREF